MKALAGVAAAAASSASGAAGGASPVVRQVEGIQAAPGLVKVQPHARGWWCRWQCCWRWAWCWWQPGAQVLVQLGALLGGGGLHVQHPLRPGLGAGAGAVAVRLGQGQQCSVAGVVGRCLWVRSHPVATGYSGYSGYNGYRLGGFCSHCSQRSRCSHVARGGYVLLRGAADGAQVQVKHHGAPPSLHPVGGCSHGLPAHSASWQRLGS